LILYYFLFFPKKSLAARISPTAPPTNPVVAGSGATVMAAKMLAAEAVAARAHSAKAEYATERYVFMDLRLN
jgi:hypothetical protein